ncbi:MAG: glycoside hydrolase family 16 protein [Calditrichaeota bacterium]|nr:MAG: glycoside hydrolase family 16 protein [Calditrichota bacterium]MBL1205192.1 glycoside hydrolase family 16 protein [Calditrichota bacterium]NOG45022.1 glycoside hydrolase family 16 protein [Calditrichota bacterium]
MKIYIFNLFRFLLLFVLLIQQVSCSENTANSDDEDEDGPGWQLVWNDEFDSTAIDLQKWNFETGPDWYNNEAQYYSGPYENTLLANDLLVIEARKENREGREYTSSRMTTQFKGGWLYGKFEVRARMPSGKGLWPAIWMMPTHSSYGDWPRSGEIDIMELVGHDTKTVHGTLHYGDLPPNNIQSGTFYSSSSGNDFYEDFHVFTLEWEENDMRWYVDGELYQTQTQWFTVNGDYPAPFNREFFLILNVAVGGNWPGYPDETTNFPQRMYIDYVRVYQWQE